LIGFAEAMHMCPFCLATAAVVAASAAGSGGLAALVGGTLLRKSVRKHFTKDTDTKEVAHGHDDNGPQAVEGSVTQRMD
jgi:hypothetical protein